MIGSCYTSNFTIKMKSSLVLCSVFFNIIICGYCQQDFRSLLFGQISKVFLSFFPSKLQPVTNLPQDIYWGDKVTVDNTIRPFRVHFSEKSVNDLRSRLINRRRLVPPLYNSSNTYGTNSLFLNQLLEYWANEYDFKEREAQLNIYPQCITSIQGLDIHYIHIKPITNKRMVPILLVHGSPVTAFEYRSVIPFLARDDRDFVFEIIAPDIPGYGYSQHTNKKGLGGYQVGIIMKNLMRRLGHKRFYIHAGDVGIFVCNAMAAMYPDDILGYHTNLPVSLLPKTVLRYLSGALFPSAVVQAQYADRIFPLSKMLMFLISNTANIHQHATRPDQIGIGLDESPIALAAWLIQFFIVGAEGKDNNLNFIDGNIYRNYDIDEILDSFTIYWDQQCMTTVARFYAEELDFSNPNTLNIFLTPIQVPFAAINFKDEIVYQPDEFLKDKFPNLVQSITLNYGGHFAALTHPRVLAESIWSAIPKMESFNSRKSRNFSLWL